MLTYKTIDIFTSEEARYRHKPVADAVVQYIRGLKIAARCTVTRGIAGCYESGEVASARLEIVSYNLPIRICIVVPAVETGRVLAGLDGMINDGIIATHDLAVVSHRARNAFFPRQLLVRDVMTPGPKKVATDTPLGDAARMLLSASFTGLPVVDEQDCPIGVITQGDLIRKAGLPLRLGLLAESAEDRREKILGQMDARRAGEVMTSPALIIAEDRPLGEAVDVMLARDVKRLPVVDRAGRLAGMLSRLDIFRTVMREAPDWNAFRAQHVEVGSSKTVADIARRDTHVVSPETAVDEVIRIIDLNDIQRVAVVDDDGRLQGIISDRDLLRCFKTGQHEGILRRLARVTSLFKEEPQAVEGQEFCRTSAGAVMNTNLVTVTEQMPIEEAIRLMTDLSLKRLPVVDETGRFKGMISRDSLLRAGFGATA